jgi:AcrR family transcriptional regulator
MMLRVSDDQRTTDLVEAAIQLLAEDGPQALQVRRLASAAGTSTMAVYSRFGGMPELVRAVANEGFVRLGRHLAAIPQTEDCIADLLQISGAYRRNALENPHLYAMMFDSGGHDLDEGRKAFDYLVRAASRGIDAGRLDPAPPMAVAAQLWSAMHGYVLLELAGYFGTEGATNIMAPLATNLVIGLGDSPARARISAAKLNSGPGH